jgi:hypothetical protein
MIIENKKRAELADTKRGGIDGWFTGTLIYQLQDVLLGVYTHERNI